jgi:hypothetical protein
MGQITSGIEQFFISPPTDNNLVGKDIFCDDIGESAMGIIRLPVQKRQDSIFIDLGISKRAAVANR